MNNNLYPFYLIETNDSLKLKKHLAKCKDINSITNERGNTLLEYSLLKNSYEIANILYRMGATIPSNKKLLQSVTFCNTKEEMTLTLTRYVKKAIDVFVAIANEPVNALGMEYNYDHGSVMFSMDTTVPTTIITRLSRLFKNDNQPVKDRKDWKYLGFKLYRFIVIFDKKDFISSLDAVLENLNKDNYFKKLKLTSNFNYSLYEW